LQVLNRRLEQLTSSQSQAVVAPSAGLLGSMAGSLASVVGGSAAQQSLSQSLAGGPEYHRSALQALAAAGGSASVDEESPPPLPPVSPLPAALPPRPSDVAVPPSTAEVPAGQLRPTPPPARV